jgi:hypothetical protein
MVILNDAECYDNLWQKFDNLKLVADLSKNDAIIAREWTTKLELDLELRDGKIDRLCLAASGVNGAGL